jgi:hypothetical protein
MVYHSTPDPYDDSQKGGYPDDEVAVLSLSPLCVPLYIKRDIF